MNKDKKIKLLEEAKVLIAKGWTQEVYARDADGNSCEATADRACQWCLTGALDAVCGGAHNKECPSMRLWTEVENTLIEDGAVERYNNDINGGFADSVAWNDYYGRCQQDVIDVLTRTIERLQDGQKEENQAA